MVKKPSQTKERIDHCAMKLFVERGIDGTSVRDIAKKAGVADGALYRHYKSKEDLAWRLFQDNYIALAHILNVVQSKGHSGKEKIQAIIECMGETFDEDPVFFHYLFLSEHGFLNRFSRGMQTPLTIIHSVLEEAQKNREISPEIDSNQAVAVITGILLQTARFYIQGKLEGSLKKQALLLSKMCFSALSVSCIEG